MRIRCFSSQFLALVQLAPGNLNIISTSFLRLALRIDGRVFRRYLRHFSDSVHSDVESQWRRRRESSQVLGPLFSGGCQLGPGLVARDFPLKACQNNSSNNSNTAAEAAATTAAAEAATTQHREKGRQQHRTETPQRHRKTTERRGRRERREREKRHEGGEEARKKWLFHVEISKYATFSVKKNGANCETPFPFLFCKFCQKTAISGLIRLISEAN